MLEQNNIHKYLMYFKYFNYARKFSSDLIKVAIGGIVSSLVILYEPIFVKDILETTLAGRMEKVFFLSLGIWFFLFNLKHGMLYILRKYNLEYALKCYKEIQEKLFLRILKMPWIFFKKYSPGYLQSRILDDLGSLEGLLASTFILGLIGIIQIFFLVICMMFISIPLTIIIIILEIIHIYVNFYFPLKKLYKESAEGKSKVNKHLSDTLNLIEVIKLGNQYQKEKVLYGDVLKEWFDKWKNKENKNFVRAVVSNQALEANYIVIILIGGMFAYANVISVPDVLTLILYFQRLNYVIPSAINMIPLGKIGIAVGERLYELINTMEREETLLKKIKNNLEEAEEKNGIEFKNIHIRDNEMDILKNINVKLSNNSLHILVGRSGSGKSTFCRALVRFLIEDRGDIFVDGKNVNTIPLLELRRRIKYLGQEARLFERDIEENINYYGNATERRTEYIEKLRLDDVMERSMKSIEAIKVLSGGEKQRVAFLREMIKNGDIIILDEPTSGIDKKSEKVINELIIELSKNHLVILATHSLELVTVADTIHVFENGEIVESGKHEELLNNRSYYFNLWNSNGIGEK